MPTHRPSGERGPVPEPGPAPGRAAEPRPTIGPGPAIEPGPGPEALRGWTIPYPVLRGSLRVIVSLLVPVVVAYALVGATAAMAVGLGYTGGLAPALAVSRRYALALSVPAALTAVAAVGVHGQALPAACFAALACLLVAPANAVSNGLLAGLPTIAAVYTSVPTSFDPARVGLGVLAGALIVSLLLGARERPDVAPAAVGAGEAWRHAVAMAAVVGLAVWLMTRWDVPHGYWMVMTMTVVLRPYGRETQEVARQRVVGTVVGAALGLGLALLLPGWASLAVAGLLLVPMVASAVLGRYAQQVAYLTPFVVLLGSGTAEQTASNALERVLATLLGALIAGAVALVVLRIDRSEQAEQAERAETAEQAERAEAAEQAERAEQQEGPAPGVRAERAEQQEGERPGPARSGGLEPA